MVAMSTSTVCRRLAALFMAGAAAVHLGVTGAHFAQWWVYGVFFLLVAAAQLGWASAAWLRLDRRVVLLGAAGNLVLIVLWLLTRTVGVPVGPQAGVPEPFGAADAIAAGFEAVVVGLGLVALALARGDLGATGQVPRQRAVVATAATAALVVVGSGVAMAVPGDLHAATGTVARGSSSAVHGYVPSATGNGQRHELANLPDVSAATGAQTAAATELLTRLEAATSAYRDVAAATAAGYDVAAAVARVEKRRPGAQVIPALHVPNPALWRDGKEADPQAPETLVYHRDAAGGWTLIGVMLRPEEPTRPPSGHHPYLRWHSHTHCVTAGQPGRTKPGPGGACPDGSRAAQGRGYMAHVWFVRPTDLVHAYAMRAPRPQIAAYQRSIR